MGSLATIFENRQVSGYASSLITSGYLLLILRTSHRHSKVGGSWNITNRYPLVIRPSPACAPHLAKSDTRPTLLCTTTMYSVTRFNSDGIFPAQLFFCSCNPDNFFSIRVQFNCLCSKKYSFHLQLMGFNRLEKNCCK